MRELDDGAGGRWDVMVGHESWGTFVLLFARRDRPDTRTHALGVETAAEAERELAALSDEELRHRLAAAAPWG